MHLRSALDIWFRSQFRSTRSSILKRVYGEETVLLRERRGQTLAGWETDPVTDEGPYPVTPKECYHTETQKPWVQHLLLASIRSAVVLPEPPASCTTTVTVLPPLMTLSAHGYQMWCCTPIKALWSFKQCSYQHANPIKFPAADPEGACCYWF